MAALIQESLAVATHRCSEACGLRKGHCRHDRAAEGGGVPDRRQADASRPRAAGEAGQEHRHQGLRQSYEVAGNTCLSPAGGCRRSEPTARPVNRDIIHKFSAEAELESAFAHPPNGWLSCFPQSWSPLTARPIENRLSPPRKGVLHSD